MSDEVIIPDVCNMQSSIAQQILENQNLVSQCIGNGTVIMSQDPHSGTIVKRGSTIRLIVNNRQIAAKNEFRTVPNVIGLSLRRAINRLGLEGFETHSYGSGIVISQSPESGVTASEKTIVSLTCEKQNVTASR